MDNNIISFLNIEDRDISVLNISISGNTKTVELIKPLTETFCPVCMSRMYSKGVRKRTVNHPILQDGFKLRLILHQRRWMCTNPDCRNLISDSFSFVEPRRRNTNITDFIIVQAFRNIDYSAADIAERFNVSDTYAIEVFDRYVCPARLPLTEAICIDEVYVNSSSNCKFALIIMDFFTGEPIDILESRRTDVTEPYFAGIPFSERSKVKYLITDMYKPYIGYIDRYFPNATSVIDSFHVIKEITNKLNIFMISLYKTFKSADERRFMERKLQSPNSARYVTSNEAYMLKKHRWIMLKNVDTINYNAKSTYDRHFHMYMDAYRYESIFMGIHPDFQELRDLKEEYISFNNEFANRPQEAAEALDNLIQKYSECRHRIFHDIASTLKNHRDAIIRSFIMVKRYGKKGEYESRLSNGPIESLNRKPKDIKRNGRGYTNFQHLRNRVLFAARKDPSILAVPRDSSEYHNFTGKTRGSYVKRGKENDKDHEK